MYLVMASLIIEFDILNDVVSVSMHDVCMLKVQSFHLARVSDFSKILRTKLLKLKKHVPLKFLFLVV